MNSKSQGYFEKLEQKLIDAGIPSEIAKNYVMHYKRGISPELSFENDELPSDDHFKALSKMYKVFCKQFKDQPISEVTIKDFLLTPYSQIEAARKRISELFEKHSDKISELYENDIHIYDLRADEATYIYELISDYITDEEKLWQVFKKAAIVGEFYTDNRIEAVVDAVGKTWASEVIYESVVNGYLLYPYYTDPIKALKFLRTQFDEHTTAKIIIENPDYLYLYKDEFHVEYPGQKEKRELQIAEILAKYKKQFRIGGASTMFYDIDTNLSYQDIKRIKHILRWSFGFARDEAEIKGNHLAMLNVTPKELKKLYGRLSFLDKKMRKKALIQLQHQPWKLERLFDIVSKDCARQLIISDIEMEGYLFNCFYDSLYIIKALKKCFTEKQIVSIITENKDILRLKEILPPVSMDEKEYEEKVQLELEQAIQSFKENYSIR